MRKTIKKLLPLVMLIGLFACSNSDKTPATNEPAATAPATSDLMKDEPAYDATKIDPAAKVVELTLDAQGNTMTDMKYDNTDLRVPAGTTVKIKFTNKGTDAAMIHNFVIIEEGSADEVAKAGIAAGPDKGYVPATNKVLFASKLLGPKESTELTFPAPAKGVYDFICTYPGHYKMMNGKFVVE